jgi:hypothetical protein
MIGALDNRPTCKPGPTITWTRPLLGALTKESPPPTAPRILCTWINSLATSTTAPKPVLPPEAQETLRRWCALVSPASVSLLSPEPLFQHYFLLSAVVGPQPWHKPADPRAASTPAVPPSPTASRARHWDEPFTLSPPLLLRVRFFCPPPGIEFSSRLQAEVSVSRGRFASGA